jgi:[ribosomal protein S18]-alanine N-acetyltransferase
MSTTLNMIELRDGSPRDIAVVDTRNQCLGVLAMPGVWLTLAYIDDRPAGFALSRQVLDEAELLLLATAPDMRRRGVGAALLRSVEARARSEGAVSLHLEVREGNDAIKLYRRAGLNKIGQRRDYYRGTGGQQFDALTFRRDLA